MRVVLYSIVLGICGCNASPTTPAASPPKPTAPAVTLGNAALETLPGDAPVDVSVRDAQALVRTLPGEVDRWVALGEAWVHKARDAQSENLYGRAEDAAKKALALQPGARGALRIRALVHRNAHRFADMKTVADQLVKLDPKDPDGWGLLGDAQLELGAYDAAAESYQNMIDRRPALPAFTRIAWLRWLNDDVEGALEMWESAGAGTTGAAPETRAWLASEIGEVFWLKGDLVTAEIAFSKGLVVKPDHGPCLFGRGRVRWAQGDLPGAIADLKASVAARRSEPVFAWLAALHRAAGDTAQAARIEAMLATPEDFDDPRSAALYLATRRLSPGRAVELAEVDMKARGDLFAEDALAFALLRAGRPGEAAKHMANALRLQTPHPMLWAHAGLIALAQGDKPNAKAHLQKALALNPKFDPVLAPEIQGALAGLEAP